MQEEEMPDSRVWVIIFIETNKKKPVSERQTKTDSIINIVNK